MTQREILEWAVYGAYTSWREADNYKRKHPEDEFGINTEKMRKETLMELDKLLQEESMRSAI